MKKTFVSLMIALVLFLNAFGQKDYFFSSDSLTSLNQPRLVITTSVGSSFDVNKALQNNQIGQSHNLTTERSYEFLLSVRVWQCFYAESGVSSRPIILGYSYQEIIDNDDIRGSSSGGHSFLSLVFPVRVKYLFPLEESPISLFVYGGFKAIVVNQEGEVSSSESFRELEDGTRQMISQSTTFVENRRGAILNMGLTITLDLIPSVSVVVSGEYDYGLTPMGRMFVKYYKEDGAVTNSIFNYASGYRFSAGFQYRF